MKKLLITSLLLLTSACGWQLRDAQIVPQDLGSLHISARDPHSTLVLELKRALQVYGVDLVNSREEAHYTVVIADFRQNRRTATVNARARIAEYQLNEDVDFLILGADDSQLIPLSTASVERVYEFDENDVLASRNEEQLVREEMREEIIRQILSRLRIAPSAIQPDNATNQ